MTANQELGQSGPRRRPSKARLTYQRLRQFLALPGCYRQVRAFKECPRRGAALAGDLLTLFFSYKTFPDHYGLCRLWEVDREGWKYYYGSNYHPLQRARISAAMKQPDYRIMFVDKFLCTMYAKGVGIRGPETFGLIDPADDYRDRLRSWLRASPAQAVIIKPLYGRGGQGIVIARRAGDGAVVQTPRASLALDDFVLEDRSVVQELLRQDARMAAFSPFSVNTLRLITMLTKRGEVILVNGSMRSGVGESFVDNWSAGGVSVGVDCERGVLKRYAYDKNWRRFAAHPTSGTVFEDYPIPEWERVRAVAVSIQKAFAFYRLIGLDLALGPGGEPLLIEINGSPDLSALEQKAGPLLKNERVLRAFGEYELLVNKHQRRIYAELESRRTTSRKAEAAHDGKSART
jgi:glutathione synthase/RimK-type ligase-like ATP-grasp enzyme